MRIGIVGSRDYSKPDRVRAYIRWNLSKEDHLVTGGARGVDTWAEEEARYLGIPVTIYQPDWAQFGKSAGPIRNQQIVNDCDEIIAFWNGRSRGTMSTIGLARRAGKKVRVIGDGD